MIDFFCLGHFLLSKNNEKFYSERVFPSSKQKTDLAKVLSSEFYFQLLIRVSKTLTICWYLWLFTADVMFQTASFLLGLKFW